MSRDTEIARASYKAPALANAQATVRSLVDRWREANGPLLSPHVPEDMRVDEADLEDPAGWPRWKPAPSQVTMDDIAAINLELPAPLPLSFVAYLTAYALLPLDFGGYVLPGIPTTETLQEVRAQLLGSGLHPTGFGQIGHANGSGDPICLDLQKVDKQGECPVVLFNHDNVPTASWRCRESLLPQATTLRATFLDFLEGLVDGDEDLFPPPSWRTRRGAE